MTTTTTTTPIPATPTTTPVIPPVPVPATKQKENNEQEQQQQKQQENQKPTKKCHCVLCGKMIVAETEDDCIAHMATCDAFQRVHPSTGPTNPNGVYPDGRGPTTSPTSPPDTPDDDKDVDQMTIRELKKVIASAGLSFVDCIEKEDLRIRAREAIGKTN
eukprot:CAMPEP_0198260110 /NCGR_PEP_ID=MMETSP1447-20131203/9156_1 /TAXON_ID=420782 /ORGANISM="Chaetoceros dichaeta, Strain CCMP1751" /LENGTH=159 /DNA_ID=CAMNT_0043947685 /DNA_START=22 /DNA_END=501 /DNA_ORIENTATION=-